MGERRKMSLVKELYFLTKGLYDHVSQPLPEDLEEREQYIEKVDEYLKKRMAILEKVSTEHQWSDAEIKLGRELVKMNEVIKEQLEKSKGQILLDLDELKKKKAYNHQYEKNYGGPTVDGVFFDKKN